MDIAKLAGSLSEGQREKIAALGGSEAARALEGMFSEAELIRAASGGDAAAVQGVLRRILSTDEGRRLAQMLDEAMK